MSCASADGTNMASPKCSSQGSCPHNNLQRRSSARALYAKHRSSFPHQLLLLSEAFTLSHTRVTSTSIMRLFPISRQPLTSTLAAVTFEDAASLPPSGVFGGRYARSTHPRIRLTCGARTRRICSPRKYSFRGQVVSGTHVYGYHRVLSCSQVKCLTTLAAAG